MCKATEEFIELDIGRSLKIQNSTGKTALFHFNELCKKSLGSADYITIANRYNVIFITDIPKMKLKQKEEARRFITLIDELYNHKIRLICLAEVPPEKLFITPEEAEKERIEDFEISTLEREIWDELRTGRKKLNNRAANQKSLWSKVNLHEDDVDSLLTGQEEVFMFKRAVSRLLEMQTPAYWENSKK